MRALLFDALGLSAAVGGIGRMVTISQSLGKQSAAMYIYIYIYISYHYTGDIRQDVMTRARPPLLLREDDGELLHRAPDVVVQKSHLDHLLDVLSLCLSLSIYIEIHIHTHTYIYIYIYIYTCIYVYIYIYIYLPGQELEPPAAVHEGSLAPVVGVLRTVCVCV